jgi:hypothetical protein
MQYIDYNVCETFVSQAIKIRKIINIIHTQYDLIIDFDLNLNFFKSYRTVIQITYVYEISISNFVSLNRKIKLKIC